MIVIAAFAGMLMLQAQGQLTPEYIEINSTLMRSCSRGAVDAQKGQARADAIADCDASLDSEPLNRLGMAQTLVNRGVIKLRVGDSAGALADFNGAVKQQPDLAAAYQNRASLLITQRRYDEALADADKAVKLDAANARAVFLRGAAYELKGNANLAYRDYKTAARLDPAWEDPKVELTRFTVKAKK